MAGATVRLVNGVLRTIQPTVQYTQSYVVPAGGLPSSTILTLPSSGSYLSNDLSVFVDGQRMEAAYDYSYVGTGTRTQITVLFALKEAQRVLFVVDPA